MRFFNIYFLLLISMTIIFKSCFLVKEIDYENISIDSLNDTMKISDKKTKYQNQVFVNNIKTVLLHPVNNEMLIPIINLNSEEKLKFSFDDLNSDVREYRYTLIHCDSEWQESDLMRSEYIDGMYSNPITDYQFSFNTTQEYVHYSLIFPEENLKPIISGNYIIKVSLNEKEMLTRRFMVLEKKVDINAEIKKATLAKDRKLKHEIDLNILHNGIKILDPFSDIRVVIKQNNREDNSITKLKPIFIKNEELIYDYEEENTFFGGNEFRYFDTRSLRFYSDRIDSIAFNDSIHHVWLLSDYKRTFNNYAIIPDINGKFIIKSQEGWDSEIEADYTWVHFKLPMEQKVSYGDIYIFGEFNSWMKDLNSKLTYNSDMNRYEKSILLKQGYYNYCYILHDTIVNRVDMSFIEGSHYETRNDYYIYVFHKSENMRYEKLIGYIKLSSNNLF